MNSHDPRTIEHTTHAALAGRHTSRVLLAQAPGFTRDRVKRYLESDGYEVACADSIDASLETARVADCRIVLAGTLADASDGALLCKHMRELVERQPFILVLCPESSPKRSLAAFSAGADDVINAGLSQSELLARVRVAERTLARQRATHPISTDEQ